jgi:uncharacterized protein YndB with AHSA1/START domain
MAEQIEVHGTIAASPAKVYAAWIDSAEHAAMTGGDAAESDAVVGGRFTAANGYIAGTYLELVPDRRIVQTWRTSEFPADAPDSQLVIELTPTGDSALVTLHHTNIPDGQGERYRSGWVEYYFSPMQRYFAAPAAAPKPKAPAKKTAAAKPKPKAKAKAKVKAKPKAKAAKAKAKPKAKKKAKKKGKR